MTDIIKKFFAILLIATIPFVVSATEPEHHEKDNSEAHTHDTHSAETDGHQTESHENSSHGEELNALEHIADAYSLHYWTNKEGHHVSVYLPIILYSKTSGFNVFMSSKLAHGHTYKNFAIPEEGDYKGKIVELDAHGEILSSVDEEGIAHAALPIDISITKNITMMLLAALFMLMIFISVGNAYKKRGVKEPKGLQALMEPVIVFVQDEIAIPNIGEKKYKKFLPYLLTVFFFILFLNLMGLVPVPPFGANVTGNIGVTFTLAIFTFIITQFSGNKNYWRHIFATPGVPIWLLPIMIPVEIIGMLSKPFALMVRLFANITAGHIIVLSLVSVIFLFHNAASSVPIFFVLFMDVLELLVAFLQAYIFTLLSALFIGLAVVEDHH